MIMTNNKFKNKVKSDRVMLYQTLLGKHPSIFAKLTDEEKFDLYKTFLFSPLIWQNNTSFNKKV